MSNSGDVNADDNDSDDVPDHIFWICLFKTAHNNENNNNKKTPTKCNYISAAKPISLLHVDLSYQHHQNKTEAFLLGVQD